MNDNESATEIYFIFYYVHLQTNLRMLTTNEGKKNKQWGEEVEKEDEI